VTPEQFTAQLGRLVTRFSEKAFDQEFSQLVWREVHDMSEQAFTRTCDVMIGSRKHNDPPRLTDFREARLKEQKYAFDRDIQGACKVLAHPALAKPLADILKRDFGAVSGVKDALEIARLRNKTKDGK
jgi:hypothetical protein